MKSIFTVLLLLLFASIQALAQPLKSKTYGYADLHYQWFNYGLNQNREKGSQKDSRALFDAHRFVIGHEILFPNAIELEVELEIEHAGTGSAMELEYEEAGEFELESEKGGEVYLEELYIEKILNDELEIKTGLIKVAVGQTGNYNKPNQYLSATRPESEENIIPVTWSEMGAQLTWEASSLSLTTQIINGLDSTGFSSQKWIAEGQQKKFEEKKASDLAYTLRADFIIEQLEIGLSAYYGSTSRNRPKADLAKTCENKENKIAACGYTSADVLLTDLHYRWQNKNVFTQGVALFGMLENSDKITEANATLSNALAAPKSPVARQAYFTWVELGYKFDSLPKSGGWNLYTRFQKYDSMHKVEKSIADNARFDRRVISLGTGYNLDDFYLAKFEISQRQFGLKSQNKENTFTISNSIIF